MYMVIIIVFFPVIFLYIIFVKSGLSIKLSSRDSVIIHETEHTKLTNKQSNIVEESYQLADETDYICHKEKSDEEEEYMTCSICLESLEIEEHFRRELSKETDCEIYIAKHDQELMMLKPKEKYSKIQNIVDETEFTTSDCRFSGALIILKNDVCLTSCGHYFHYGCFRSWYHRRRECAQCRSTVSLLDCRIIYKTDLNKSKTVERQYLETYVIRKLIVVTNEEDV